LRLKIFYKKKLRIDIVNFLPELWRSTFENSNMKHCGKKGDGNIIVFTDNTNFRAFWLGTEKLLWNAIFFSKLM